MTDTTTLRCMCEPDLCLGEGDPPNWCEHCATIDGELPCPIADAPPIALNAVQRELVDDFRLPDGYRFALGYLSGLVDSVLAHGDLESLRRGFEEFNQARAAAGMARPR